MNSSEIFSVECVLGGPNAPLLQLQLPQFDNAMARILASGNVAAGDFRSTLQTIFADGRFVNIFDPSRGYSAYGVIAQNGFTYNGIATAATVQLAAIPGIPVRPTSPCGIDAIPNCRGNLLVSVVSRVMYDVCSVTNPAVGSACVPPNNGAFANMVGLPPNNAAAVTGDNQRTELVRVELDPNGNPVPNTFEVVSEYAVDLRFGLTVSTLVTPPNFAPTVKSYGITNPPAAGDPVHTIAGAVTNGPAATPELIRSVLVRLATRARAPERPTPMPATPTLDGRLLHFFVPLQAGSQTPPPVAGGPLQYARVRTNYANVSLPNQGGFALW